MKNILLFIHQLPQNILGLLLNLIYKGKKIYTFDDGVNVYISEKMPGGISLGKTIILNNFYIIEDYDLLPNQILKYNAYKHEHGHSIQSKYLGWLYLIIIGLPSLIWAACYNGDNYYSFYTERWADKLGGVKR